MNKLVGVGACVATMLLAGSALAADVKGTISSVNPTDRTVIIARASPR